MTRKSKDHITEVGYLVVIASSIAGGITTGVSWWLWGVTAVVLIYVLHVIRVKIWYTQKEKAEFEAEEKERSQALQVPSNINDLFATKGTKAGQRITLFQPSDMQRPTIGRRTLDCFLDAGMTHLTLSTVRGLIEREVKEQRFDQFDIKLLEKAAVDFPTKHCRAWVPLDAINGAFAYGVYHTLGKCLFAADDYEALALDMFEPANRNVNTLRELTEIKGSHYARLRGGKSFPWGHEVPNVDINSVTCAVLIRELLRYMCDGPQPRNLKSLQSNFAKGEPIYLEWPDIFNRSKTRATKKLLDIFVDIGILPVLQNSAVSVTAAAPVAGKFKEITEPNAAPNGGPATRLGNSDVTAGPPSVS